MPPLLPQCLSPYPEVGSAQVGLMLTARVAANRPLLHQALQLVTLARQQGALGLQCPLQSAKDLQNHTQRESALSKPASHRPGTPS